ncbi:hypothetical protein VSDG_02810 [Cytospora chrysosperma]|uniref:Peptidase A1 domain-containing protein n=1 Tax=Cytospora chrysosperma TaxID=252740 RepID=A0A423WD22_CYTCH|nr:hypothetical protein VSDG_02810 [Valsa sordida]
MAGVLLSLACLPGTLSAILELPIRLNENYAMVEVEVGTPPVSHSLLFDTGSSTTWMVTDACDGTDDCPNGSGYNRTGYSASGSSTYKPMGTYAKMDFLGGLTSGSGVKDVFSVPSSPNVTWTQSFVAANESSWYNIPADGFLGLGFSTIADANTTTVVETLMQDGLLDKPRFALYYGTEIKDTGDGPGNGKLTFGGSHEDVYVEGDLLWSELQPADDQAQLWRVEMQNLIGTKPSNSTYGSTQSAVAIVGDWGVFDTGAGRISVPDSAIEEIYASIGMNWTAIINGDHIPLCTEFTDAWSVEFDFGSPYTPTVITLTGEMLKVPGFATGEDKYCWPPFDASGSDGLFLFGNQFLEKFYTVFDFGAFEPADYAARIGFGVLKEEYKP